MGIALNTMGDARRGEEAITLALNTPRQDERQWMADCGSSLRDNALMLSLLEENNLQAGRANALLSSLSEGRPSVSVALYRRTMPCSSPRDATGQRGRTASADLFRAQPLAGDKALTP